MDQEAELKTKTQIATNTLSKEAKWKQQRKEDSWSVQKCSFNEPQWLRMPSYIFCPCFPWNMFVIFQLLPMNPFPSMKFTYFELFFFIYESKWSSSLISKTAKERITNWGRHFFDSWHSPVAHGSLFRIESSTYHSMFVCLLVSLMFSLI